MTCSTCGDPNVFHTSPAGGVNPPSTPPAAEPTATRARIRAQDTEIVRLNRALVDARQVEGESLIGLAWLIAEADRRLQGIEALHPKEPRNSPKATCATCNVAWPCPTVAILRPRPKLYQRATLDAYLRRATEDDSGCWTWRGRLTADGYGSIKIDNRQRPAHRVIYERLVGPIPDGLQIDHLCRNRACVNPDHLEPVTGRENVLRGLSPAAQNAAKAECPQGHQYQRRHSGNRYCPTCQTEKARVRRAARRSAQGGAE